MKYFVFSLLVALLLAGCSSLDELLFGSSNAGSNTASRVNQPEDIVTAMKEASDYINQRVPEGSKLAIISISSDYPLLSEYIIDSLMENIVNGNRLTVVDRGQLDAIRAELYFQMSTDVDEDSAQAVGRMVGAQTIILGSISPFGNMYRLTVRVLAVETAQVQGLFNRNIQSGATINTLTGGQVVSAVNQTGTTALSVNAGNFAKAFDEIKAAASGVYTITLTEDITLYAGIDFADFGTKTITIQGDSQMRTITRPLVGNTFTIPENVVLVLENNITLTGGDRSSDSVVLVAAGGTFEMRSGSIIRDNISIGVNVLGLFNMSGGSIIGNGGPGVYVRDGTFNMSGGTIGGNRPSGVFVGGTFNMSGGTIGSNEGTGVSVGGGLSINDSVFSMSGGTISRNFANNGGGVYVENTRGNSGTFIKTGGTINDTNIANRGRVVFFGDSGSGWVRNSSAGPTVNMDTRISGRQGGWE